MIKSFRSKETEKLFSRQRSPRFPADVHRIALRKLLLADAAERLEDLRIPPGNRLEKLTGNRQGNIASASMTSGVSVFAGRGGCL